MQNLFVIWCIFFVKAVPETIRELKTALWAAEATGGAANLTGALTTAFEILHRVCKSTLSLTLLQSVCSNNFKISINCYICMHM